MKKCKKMSIPDAVGIAEGYISASDSRVLIAWQVLVDTGLVWELQGSFGRMAKELIEAGLVELPKNPGAKIMV